MLYYQDIFPSLQGESSLTGYPCTFIRLYGCNVGCVFCDQKQESYDKKKISEKNILSLVKEFGLKHVCITGGEPLLQPEVFPLIYALLSENYKVSVETSGCVLIEEDNYNRSFKYIMDVKCPSSGVDHKNLLTNLDHLKPIDEIKFVISDRNDYDFAVRIIKRFRPSAKILLSPMFSEGKQTVAQELSKWMIQDKLDARMNLQIHKIIGIL